jgi:hypothetical protein
MKQRINKHTPTNDREKTSSGTNSRQPPSSGIDFVIQKKENKTGLPDNLKSGIENLSGMDISDVRVHYNSPQPAQLNAHAYAQGNQIHVASGQEKHLAHEAWHVVQQKQGRVKPTKQLKSAVPVNDDPHLEKEADVMGAKALNGGQKGVQLKSNSSKGSSEIVQRAIWKRTGDHWVFVAKKGEDGKNEYPDNPVEGEYFDDMTGVRGQYVGGQVVPAGNAVAAVHAYPADGPKYLRLKGDEVDYDAYDVEQMHEKHTKKSLGLQPEAALPAEHKLTDEHRRLINTAISHNSEFDSYDAFRKHIFSYAELNKAVMKSKVLNAHKEALFFAKEIFMQLFLKKQSFENEADFLKVFDPLLAEKVNLWENYLGISAHDFGSFIKEQLVKQQEVKTQPDVFKHMFTTMGLEHEFMEMNAKSLLQGVSHLRLSSTSVKMPLTNIGFSLETDASNALELVCPPFIVRTVPGKPIPDPDEVAKADDLIRTQLTAISAKSTSIAMMVKAFQDVGLDFKIDDTLVERSNLTQNTLNDFDSETPVPAKEINKIGIGPINKFGAGQISAQVNFATDAHTFHNMQQLYSDEKPHEYIQVFSFLERQMDDYLMASIPKPSSNLKVFIHLLARTLSGQLAVPSIAVVKDFQEAEYKKLHAGKTHRNKIKEGRGTTEFEVFNFHASMSSHVKDVNGVWIKDTLMNIGRGILHPKDWKKIIQFVGMHQKSFISGLKLLPVQDFNSQVKDAYTQSFVLAKHQIAGALVLLAEKATMLIEAGAPPGFDGPEAQPDFMEHKAEWMGPRQDTFLPADKVQMPEVWGQRLHVVETRHNGIETLYKMKIVHYINTTKFNDKTIAGLFNPSAGITEKQVKEIRDKNIGNGN